MLVREREQPSLVTKSKSSIVTLSVVVDVFVVVVVGEADGRCRGRVRVDGQAAQQLAGWAAGRVRRRRFTHCRLELVGLEQWTQTRSQQDKSATTGTINHARPQDKGHEP